MKNPNSADALKTAYKTIFEKYKDFPVFDGILAKRGFVFQYDDDEDDCDLLFVGMNPSYTKKYEKGRYFENHYERNEDRQYFKPFAEIDKQLQDELEITKYKGWTHIDLFVFRETNQEFVKKIMQSAGCPLFLLEQLEIAKARIIRIQPKVVIVSNALAAEFMGKNKDVSDPKNHKGVWMDLDFYFDEEFGSHRVNHVSELKNTHFLFTSMLSGQRALDLGSRERLVWQVKRIFKKADFEK